MDAGKNLCFCLNKKLFVVKKPANSCQFLNSIYWQQKEKLLKIDVKDFEKLKKVLLQILQKNSKLINI